MFLVGRVKRRERYVHSAGETFDGVFRALSTVLDSEARGTFWLFKFGRRACSPSRLNRCRSVAVHRDICLHAVDEQDVHSRLAPRLSLDTQVARWAARFYFSAFADPYHCRRQHRRRMASAIDGAPVSLSRDLASAGRRAGSRLH